MNMRGLNNIKKSYFNKVSRHVWLTVSELVQILPGLLWLNVKSYTGLDSYASDSPSGQYLNTSSIDWIYRICLKSTQHGPSDGIFK